MKLETLIPALLQLFPVLSFLTSHVGLSVLIALDCCEWFRKREDVQDVSGSDPAAARLTHTWLRWSLQEAAAAPRSSLTPDPLPHLTLHSLNSLGSSRAESAAPHNKHTRPGQTDPPWVTGQTNQRAGTQVSPFAARRPLISAVLSQRDETSLQRSTELSSGSGAALKKWGKGVVYQRLSYFPGQILQYNILQIICVFPRLKRNPEYYYNCTNSFN